MANQFASVNSALAILERTITQDLSFHSLTMTSRFIRGAEKGEKKKSGTVFKSFVQ